uniref:Uncharacterized protein n=1 Tax=Octopus bimaculoides TaxID=37653 RepID=A0A0L8H198_OCTBM
MEFTTASLSRISRRYMESTSMPEKAASLDECIFSHNFKKLVFTNVYEIRVIQEMGFFFLFSWGRECLPFCMYICEFHSTKKKRGLY